MRVRFAPSPTGYLHVGGLRTALYNYLLAHKHGGQFILRIEDTDRNRLVADAVDNILDCLRWAGIPNDEGAGAGGEVGPYVQSERLPLYQEQAERLLAEGHAYLCFCTSEELEKLRDPKKAFRSPYRDQDPAELKKRREAGEKWTLRLKVPLDESFTLDDVIRGQVTFRSTEVDDQVLLKSDGFPTYHLAAVVDDHLMRITTVIRGEEWLSSSPKHLLLYRFLGWETPKFAHLPLIVNIQGKKLSKRDGDVSVDAYRDQGYLPMGLINFLALLGWSAGDDKEVYTLDELIQAFSLERVNKSASVFDFDKLRHINRQHLWATPAEELAGLLPAWFEKAGVPLPEKAYLTKVVTLMKERCSLLPDFVAASYFWADPDKLDEATFKKRWKAESAELLQAYAERLEKTEWNAAALEEALKALAEQKGVGAGHFIHPTRLAISGVGAGPGLYELMEVLGKDTVLRRMRHAPVLVPA